MRHVGSAALALWAAGCTTAPTDPSGPTPPLLHLVARPEAVLEFPRQEIYRPEASLRIRCRRAGETRPETKPTPGSVGAFFLAIETPEQAVELCHVLHWGALVRSREQFARIVEAHRRRGFRPEFPAVPVRTEFRPTVVPVPGGFEVAFTALVLSSNATSPMEVARFGYRVARDGWIDAQHRTVYLTGSAKKPSRSSADVLAAANPGEEEARGRRELIEELYEICPDVIPHGPHRKVRP